MLRSLIATLALLASATSGGGDTVIGSYYAVVVRDIEVATRPMISAMMTITTMISTSVNPPVFRCFTGLDDRNPDRQTTVTPNY